METICLTDLAIDGSTVLEPQPVLLNLLMTPGILVPLQVDLVAGRVNVTPASLANAMPHITSAKVRPIAIMSAGRSSLLPGLKTVDKVCILGSEKAAWFKDTEGNILCIHENLH